MELSSEVWVHIFQYLAPKDSFHISRVCWDWHNLSDDIYLWKLWHQKHYGLSVKVPPLDHSDQWKDSFKAVSLALAACKKKAGMPIFDEYVQRISAVILYDADRLALRLLQECLIESCPNPTGQAIDCGLDESTQKEITIKEAFIYAAGCGSVNTVKMMREEFQWPATLNVSRIMQDALSEACKNQGNIRMVQLLVEKYGAAVDQPDSRGIRPMLRACGTLSSNDTLIVKYLHRKGASTLNALSRGYMPFDMLYYLLIRCDGHSERDLSTGFQTLMLCLGRYTIEELKEAISLFLDTTRHPQAKNLISQMGALRFYMQTSTLPEEVLDMILARIKAEPGISIDPQYLYQCVWRAGMRADHKGVTVVKKMMEAGLDVNCVFQGRTALQALAANGEKDAVYALMLAGVDSTVYSQTEKEPLYWARMYGWEEIVAMMERQIGATQHSKKRKRGAEEKEEEHDEEEEEKEKNEAT